MEFEELEIYKKKKPEMYNEIRNFIEFYRKDILMQVKSKISGKRPD